MAQWLNKKQPNTSTSLSTKTAIRAHCPDHVPSNISCKDAKYVCR